MPPDQARVAGLIHLREAIRQISKTAFGGPAKTRKQIVTLLQAPPVRLCGDFFIAHPFGARQHKNNM